MEKLSRLIEQIYSAALEPSLWPVAVNSMQSHFRCAAAGFYVQDLQHQRVELVHLTGIDENYVKSYRQRYLADNPWHDSSLQTPGALRTEKTLDSHFKRPGFYHRTALFNEWMKPQDFIYTLGMNLTANRLHRTKLFLYRSGRSTAFESRDIDQFGCLARHLTTAIKVSRRLGQQASQGGQMLDLLERMDVGAAILDEQGFVIEANQVARTLFAAKDVLTIADGVINAVHPHGKTSLANAIRCARDLRQGRPTQTVPTVALQAVRGTRAFVIRAIPLSPRQSPPFCGREAAMVLVMTESEHPAPVVTEEIQCRYGLTGAEVQLVQWLLCGASLRQAADFMHVKYETVRWYLKNIFQKTGTRRQAELVRQLLTDHQLRRNSTD